MPDEFWRTPEVLLGIVLPWVACWTAALVAIFGGFPEAATTARWQWAPLAASLVVFGLPHGALDHLEIARLAGRPLCSPVVIALLAGYLVLTVGVVSLWWLSPAACFWGFIALTLVHWGQGDVWFAGRRTDLLERGLSARLSSAALRGALPMLGPLTWDPSAFAGVFHATTSLFGAASVSEATWASCTRAASVALGLLAVLYASVFLRADDSSGTSFRWFDIATLVALFATVPGIFAVGLYFSLWHGPRHLLRLADLRDGESTRWSAVGRTLSGSIPLTLVSIVGGIASGVALFSWSSTPPGASWFGWYLVAISGLTVPHTIVVFWMDRRQSVWRSSPPLQ